MLRQVFTIAQNTFTESIRQPIYLVLLLVTLLAIALEPSLSFYTFEDDRKLLIDMALSTLLVSGLLIAAFTATSVLSSEVENKTVLTVVSKPIARPMFVLGKYLGVAAAVTIAYWILSIAVLMAFRQGVMSTARHHVDGPVVAFSFSAIVLTVGVSTFGNYFYNWVYTSSFIKALLGFSTAAWVLVLFIGKEWQFQWILSDSGTGIRIIEPQMMIGLFLIYQGILLLTAIAIAASTRLGQIMTLVVCVGVFGLGINADHFFREAAENNFLARLCYMVTPNFQLFSPADALTQAYAYTKPIVIWITSYTVLYIIAVLALAVGLFQNREVG